MKPFDEFQPETIEEQIQHFSREPANQSEQAYVVHSLQAFYADEAALIKRVWQRLEGPQTSQTAPQAQSSEDRPFMIERQSIVNEKKPVPYDPFRRANNNHIGKMTMKETIQEYREIEESTQKLPAPFQLSERKSGTPKRLFTLLAAALVGLILMGSVLLTFTVLLRGSSTNYSARKPSVASTATSIPATPTATPLHANPPGLYVVEPEGIYRFDAQSGQKLWFYDIKANPNTGFSPNASHWVSTALVVSDGLVLFGGNDFSSTQYNSYYLYALDAASGHLRWRQPVTGEVTNVLVDAKGTIYVTTVIESNLIYAFSRDGSLLWSVPLPNTQTVPGRIDQVASGIIYGDDSVDVFALSASSGQQLWLVPVEIPLVGSLQVSGLRVVDGVVYITAYQYLDSQQSDTSYVIAYQASDGTIFWQSNPITGLVSAAPGVADGQVYVGSLDGQVYALNAQNGHVNWHFFAGDSVYVPAYISDNTLIVVTGGAGGAEIVARDALSGASKWSGQVVSLPGSSDHYLAITSSLVYYTTGDHAYAINLADGHQMVSFALPGSQIPQITLVDAQGN